MRRREGALTAMLVAAAAGRAFGGVDGSAAEWPAVATMVPGTAAYGSGHWAFTDYVYDDRGAGGSYSQPAGLGANSADAVILQITTRADVVRYLVKLNTLLVPDSTVVALAVDTDCDDATGGGSWPAGADVATPGWEHVVTAWGTGGVATGADGSTVDVPVAAGVFENVIEFDVPRSFADPGTGAWCYRGGVGLWDASAGAWLEAGTEAEPDVQNLLFRNREYDGGTAATDENDSGGFQFAKQSAALSSGDLTPFRRRIDFALLESAADFAPEDPPGDVHTTRIYDGPDFPNARPEGVTRGDNAVTGSLYNGRFHAYRMFVPASYRLDPRPAPMFPLLHGWMGDHRGFNPGDTPFWNDVVRAHRALVAKPLGRGEEVWWEHLGELDVLAVIDDVARHYEVDPDRVYLAGTSMGGLGTVKIASQHPDRFAGIFPSVPPMSDRAQGYAHPINNDWDLVELADSLRNVPVRNFTGTIDALVPAGLDSERFCDRLGERVYDHDCWRDLTGQHATYNEPRAAEIEQLLREHWRVADPAHVTYRSHPVFRRQAAETGIAHLLRYDSVYWIDGIDWPAPAVDGGCDLEDCPGADPDVLGIPTFPTDPGLPRRLTSGDGISTIDVRTYGWGDGDPVATPIEDDPSPTLVRRGLVLTPGEASEARNEIDVRVERVEGFDLDLARMGVTVAGETLLARLWGRGTFRLGLVGPGEACQATLDGTPVAVTRNGTRLVLELYLDRPLVAPLDEDPEELVLTCH